MEIEKICSSQEAEKILDGGEPQAYMDVVEDMRRSADVESGKEGSDEAEDRQGGFVGRKKKRGGGKSKGKGKRTMEKERTAETEKEKELRRQKELQRQRQRERQRGDGIEKEKRAQAEAEEEEEEEEEQETIPKLKQHITTTSRGNTLWKLASLLSIFLSCWSSGIVSLASTTLSNDSHVERKSLTTTSSAASKRSNLPSPLTHWVRLGSSIALGHPRPEDTGAIYTYQWTKNGENIRGAAQPFYYVEQSEEEDEGLYVRTVKNEADEVIEWLETLIKVSEPPQVSNNQGYYEVQEGSKFMLSVTTEGFPTPTFQWRLNGVNLPAGTSGTYLVESVTKADQGTYTCVVKNIAGEALWEEAIVDVV